MMKVETIIKDFKSLQLQKAKSKLSMKVVYFNLNRKEFVTSIAQP